MRFRLVLRRADHAWLSDANKDMTQNPSRYTLITHPRESNVTLDLMSEAADLLLDRRVHEATAKIVQANIRSLREWFHYEAQKTTLVLRRHGIERSKLPKPPKELKTEGDAKAQIKKSVFGRDRWHCRFCCIRVIDPQIPKHLSGIFSEFPWGSANLEKHACLAVRASHDHVLPRSWGGSNDDANLVTACWPCQFSRMEHRIEECGISDPREREPIRSDWDGLLRFLKVRPKN